MTTEHGVTEEGLEELSGFLRIPSISSDGKHPEELRAAAEWIRTMIGDGRLVDGFGNPIVDGVVPASTADAPTVIAYGHYDVQSPGADELWESPPFEPQVRDGWLYGRGVSDDKGNYWTLLRAALDLAAEGALPVNVRVLADGEEEVGGHAVIDYLATLDDRFDAAVIFDGAMASADQPAVTTALRGLVGFQVRLVSNERELHSGLYGGAVANAAHDLIGLLAAVIGREAELDADVAPVGDDERAGWRKLTTGAEELAAAGGTPADARAIEQYHERVWTRPSLSVHAVGAGDPLIHKTSIAAEARASLSLRLAPGQDAGAMHAELERMLLAACPAHAKLELEPWPPGDPAYISPEEPAIVATLDAVQRATGVRPIAVRSGGSIPVMAALVGEGTPTILSGFATPDDNIHAPNERMRLRNLGWGLASAREIYLELGRILRR